MVFQVAPVRIIAFIAFEALYGAVCPMSEHRKRGRTIITVIVAISTVLAILSIIRFQRKYKHHHAGQRPLLKLFAFKAVIALQITQNIIFTALANTDIFKPSAPYHVSYNDLARGLPQVLFVWELLAATILFLVAFNVRRFRAEVQSGVPKASGVGGALLDTINLSDIVQGMVYAVSKPRELSDVDAGMKANQAEYSGR